MSWALSWSTGKDAAWTLHLLRERGEDVSVLITTVTRDFDRVSIHGVRREVLRQQAAVLGLPLIEVELPWPCSNELYQFGFEAALRDVRDRLGVTRVAFGDLFLPDVRHYREELVKPLGLEPVFPLWGIRTDLLVRNMLRAGVVAHIVSLDPTRVPPRFAGWAIDRRLLDELPPTVDPCGENGEFHTLVTDGPMFAEAIPIHPGETIERDGVVYSDFTLSPGIDE